MTDASAESLLATLVHQGTTHDGPAVDLATAALLDTLAIGIAGMREPAARSVRSVVTELTQDGGVGTWSGAQRYSVTDVALLHGTACHGLDWDDFMHPMHGHCSSVLLPTLWGLGEHLGAPGADLIEAYLVGYQVDYLVSLVLSHGHYRRGWHATSTIGTIGAAAAAARLLGLDAQQASAALGIAASEASGLQVNFGTPTKGLHAGLAARNGVLAARLAQAGMTANPLWLAGQHGMLAAFGGDAAGENAGSLVAEGLLQHGITTGWGLVQKPYSSCGCSHAMVDAVLSLRDGLAVEDIDVIEVHVDPAVTRTMRETEPTDPFDARYSVSWVAAVAAADGAAGPQQFSVESIARPEVRALRERVDVTSDLEVGDHDRFAARVVVRSAGVRREAIVHHAQGHPQNPMSPDQRRAKQILALSAVAGDPDGLVDVLRTLPDVDDVGTLGDAIRDAVD